MRIVRLSLDQFRVYERLELDLSPAGLRISGRNASGKTSLIEAIALASTTRSPRSRADREIVRWSSGAEYGIPPYARIVAETNSADGGHKLEVSVEKDAVREGTFKKRFRLDGTNSRAHDVVGIVKTVLFSPEDVQLVAGPPSERRRHADILLSQIDRSYLSALANFGRVLSNRNGLLRSFLKDRVGYRSSRATIELGFWDQQLVEHGAYIIAQRERFLAILAAHMSSRAANLIDQATLVVAYGSRLPLQHDATAPPPIRERIQQIRAMYLAALEERRGEEFRRGMTVTGPHRDDVNFQIDGRDLAAFGSRGQQRLAVIAYKLAESDLITEVTVERPILLLDDVLSELDNVHRDMLLAAIAIDESQVIVTSTDDALLEHSELVAIPKATVDSGTFSMV